MITEVPPIVTVAGEAVSVVIVGGMTPQPLKISIRPNSDPIAAAFRAFLTDLPDNFPIIVLLLAEWTFRDRKKFPTPCPGRVILSDAPRL